MSENASAFWFAPPATPAANTTFRLWAPDAAAVSLVLEDGPVLAMQGAGDGVYTLGLDCAPGTAYRYRVSPELDVPDPASRAQKGGVHGWSLTPDVKPYAWRHAAWSGRDWHELVFYEVHAGLCGGYAGLVAQLPRLAALGITALELMPIAQFPGDRNWGYDGVLPYAPHPAYGDAGELRALIDAAHGAGIAVFLDVVYNHFGPEGNYLSAYAAGFFRRDRITPWGPAIDFRTPAVREFFIGNALYWLNEFRFDGLRLDAVHAIDDEAFLDEFQRRVHSGVGPARRVYLVLENEHNQARLLRRGYAAQWNDDGHNVLHHLLTGEAEAYYAAYKERPAEKLARCLSEGFVYQGETPPGGKGPRGERSADLPPGRFVLFLQNHDQIGNRAFGERLIALAHADVLRAATLLLLLSPQTPLLFMGEEWGCRQPFLFFTSFGDELAEKVREGRRREFARFAAFNAPESRARIPDPNAPATYSDSQPDFSAARRDVAQREWEAYYGALLGLRRDRLQPGLPVARSVGAGVLGAKAIVARWQLGDAGLMTLAINLADDDLPWAAPRTTPLAVSRDRIETLLREGMLPGRSAVAFLDPEA